MALTTQQKWYAYQRILKAQRSAGASESFSAEALAAFANYDTLGDGLTDAEKVAMAAYIDAEVAAGNHDKKDYEIIMTLSGDNALVDYIGGKVAVNVGATFGANGAIFNGTNQYVKSSFTPSTDKINSSLNDMAIAAFHYSTSKTNDFQIIIGARSSAGTENINIQNSNDSITRVTYTANSANTASIATSFLDKTLYTSSRESSTTIRLYVNGVSVSSEGFNNSTAIPDNELYIGAENNIGSPNKIFGGVASSAHVFQVSGVDHIALNTNLRALFTSLGLVL